MNEQIDTFNRHMVGVQGEKIVILIPPRAPMTEAEALTFAAWIVTLTHVDRSEFTKYLDAIEGC